MLNKKITIDLNEENENTENNSPKTQDNFDIGINFNENNNTEQKTNNNNKEEQSKWENKNNDFWLNTKLIWDETEWKETEWNEAEWEKDNTDLIKQLTKQWININKNIDDKVYEQILKKYKKRSKLKYVFIIWFIFIFIWSGLFYIFQKNSLWLDTIWLTNIINNVKENIDKKSTTNKQKLVKNKTNTSHKQNNSQNQLKFNRTNVSNLHQNLHNNTYKKQYDKLIQDIISYYEKKILEKIKNLDITNKKNILFKFKILKYEFKKNYINFEQFSNEVNKLISNMK